MFHNERGAVLWIVLICCFLLMLFMASISLFVIEHKDLLQMRIKQLQAKELVLNGIDYLKECIAVEYSFEESNIIVSYANGYVTITIMMQNEEELYARIVGYEKNGGVQTYDVKFDLNTNQVIFFEKWGMSS